MNNEKQCKICGKEFSIPSNLKRHIKRLHGEKEIEKKVVCNLCDYKCRDKYQLKVHQRSHIKEKPFRCHQCGFASSKQEDVTRHLKKCNGPKYKCHNCDKSFKSKSAVNDHHNWDSVCGNLGNQSQEQKLVKIVINPELSVLGVNCQELIDKELFEKRRRKTRCGVCYNCSVEQDCGHCKVCLAKKSCMTKQFCLKRSCLNPVDLFQLKSGQESRILSGEGGELLNNIELVDNNTLVTSEEGVTCITMSADVIQSQNI